MRKIILIFVITIGFVFKTKAQCFDFQFFQVSNTEEICNKILNYAKTVQQYVKKDRKAVSETYILKRYTDYAYDSINKYQLILNQNLGKNEMYILNDRLKMCDSFGCYFNEVFMKFKEADIKRNFVFFNSKGIDKKGYERYLESIVEFSYLTENEKDTIMIKKKYAEHFFKEIHENYFTLERVKVMKNGSNVTELIAIAPFWYEYVINQRINFYFDYWVVFKDYIK